MKVWQAEEHKYTIELSLIGKDDVSVLFFGERIRGGKPEFFMAEGEDVAYTDTTLSFGLFNYAFSWDSQSVNDSRKYSRSPNDMLLNLPIDVDGRIHQSDAVLQTYIANDMAYSARDEVIFKPIER